MHVVFSAYYLLSHELIVGPLGSLHFIDISEEDWGGAG